MYEWEWKAKYKCVEKEKRGKKKRKKCVWVKTNKEIKGKIKLRKMLP